MMSAGFGSGSEAPTNSDNSTLAPSRRVLTSTVVADCSDSSISPRTGAPRVPACRSGLAASPGAPTGTAWSPHPLPDKAHWPSHWHARLPLEPQPREPGRLVPGLDLRLQAVRRADDSVQAAFGGVAAVWIRIAVEHVPERERVVRRAADGCGCELV